MAALGMKAGLLMVFFSVPWLTTETWVTSLPVPAVVGTAMMASRLLGGKAAALVVVQGLARVGGDGRGKLGRVHGAAAADADDGLRAMGAAEAHGLLDAGELGVLLHLGEDGHEALVLLHHGLRLRGEVPPADQNARLTPSSSSTSPSRSKRPSPNQILTGWA